MKQSILLLCIVCAMASCRHYNATPPTEEIVNYPIVQDSSVLFIPVTASNLGLSTIIQSKIPDPLVSEKKNISVPVFNPITTPQLWVHTVMVDGTCDVVQRVRVSWKCMFCPSCCFALVTVQQACKIAKPISEWVNQTVISKVTTNVPVEYWARVNSISIDGNDDTLHVHVLLDLKAKADIPIAHVGLASCGFGETPPQVELTFTARVKMVDGGQLLLNEKDLSLKWNIPCNLTAMDISVEDLLNLPIVKQMISDKINNVVQNKIPNAFNFKDPLQKEWDLIANPHVIEKLGFIDLGITELSSRNLFVSSDQIQMQVGAVCRPLFNLTDEDPVPTVRPFPKLTVKNGNDSFNVTVLAALSIDKLNAAANKELENQRAKLKQDYLDVSSLRLYQHRENLVAEVELRKPFRGKVYLVGRPYFDLNTNTIRMGKMELTVASQELLGKMAGRLLQVSLIQNLLSSVVHYKYEKDIATALDKTKNLHRQLATGVFLRVRCNTLSPVGVIISGNKINVTANAKGKAMIVLE